MRQAPPTLPTITPVTVLLVVAQSELCVKVLNRAGETVNLPVFVLRLERGGGEKGVASYSFFHAPLFSPPPHCGFHVKAIAHP